VLQVRRRYREVAVWRCGDRAWQTQTPSSEQSRFSSKNFRSYRRIRTGAFASDTFKKIAEATCEEKTGSFCGRGFNYPVLWKVRWSSRDYLYSREAAAAEMKTDDAWLIRLPAVFSRQGVRSMENSSANWRVRARGGRTIVSQIRTMNTSNSTGCDTYAGSCGRIQPMVTVFHCRFLRITRRCFAARCWHRLAISQKAITVD
jgi:hypothetical protein